MRAEISHFAMSTVGPVKLMQIVKTSTPMEVADLVHKQLPVHFATRIVHIEKLPCWDEVDELVDVHQILTDSFHNLRLVEKSTDLQPLTDVIRDLRMRHKK